MNRLLWGGLLAMGVACGDQDVRDVAFELPLPRALREACPQPQNLASPGLQAELRISGGFPSCQLQVNQQTFTAAGECREIQTGLPRFLMVRYWQPLAAPAPRDTPIAYHVGFIDLSEVGSGEDKVNVNLTVGGSNSQIISEVAEFDALPDSATTLDGTLLERAQGWARDEIGGLGGTDGGDLDLDDDECSNVFEVCNGLDEHNCNTDCGDTCP